MDAAGFISSVFGTSPLWLALACALVFMSGYIDSIAGGGGLVSLPAFMAAGLPAHAAIATNKLSATMGTTVATWHYARSGLIDWKLAAPCIPCAVAGSCAGSSLVLLIDAEPLKVLLVVVLPLTAAYVLRSKAFDGEGQQGLSPAKTCILSCAFAFALGAYDGFYGPGTGTFLILLLTGVARLGLDAAAGLTKAINLSTNAAALAVFFVNGQVMVPLGLLAGAFAIAGNYIGSHRFTSRGAAMAKPLIVVVLSLLLVKVIFDIAG